MKKNVCLIAVLAIIFTGSVINAQVSETKAAEGGRTKETVEKKAGSETKKSEAKTSDSSAAQPAAEKKAEVPAKEVKAEPIKTGAASAEAVAGKLSVAEISITTNIENRVPLDPAEKFTVGVEKLYCYTKIVGGTEGSRITHRWKKGDEIMANINLNVNGSPWRTFSSKNIMKEWTGNWTVEVLDGETVLTTTAFTIE